MGVIKWTDTESLHHIRKRCKLLESRVPGFEYPVMNYRGKVKLHGTNGGIQCHPDGRVVSQSRGQVLSLESNNCGFATWVHEHEDYWQSLPLPGGNVVVVYGEWVGPGVQKGCAIHQIDSKIFAVFAIQYLVGGEAVLVTDPENIDVLLTGERPEELHVLPWHGIVEHKIHWGDVALLEKTVDFINQEVASVEACDPWVRDVFGKEGLGEGLVYFPVEACGKNREATTDWLFKAKGEKHQVVKTKKPVVVDAAKAASVQEFVDLVLPEARLEQGLQEACDGLADMKRTGPFLKWIGQDVKKECQPELEAAGLEWKDVTKAVTTHARNWLLSQAKAL